MDSDQLIDRLKELPVEELIAVLRAVFEDPKPWLEQTSYYRSRFFLGTASAELESDEGEPERWGPWEIHAVAYPDPIHNGDGLGPTWGLCQEGPCSVCGVRARSNVKHGICSVCGASVGMT